MYCSPSSCKESDTTEWLNWTELNTLLEHYISCCSSRQLPWVPGAARTLETQAAAPPLYLALTGTNPSPPGQPQHQTPVNDPHVKVEIKPQLKSRSSVAKKEDPKPFHQLYNLQIKSIWSTRQTLCLWSILKVIESSHKRKHASSDSCGHWRWEHRGVGPDQNLSCPQQQVQRSAQCQRAS